MFHAKDDFGYYEYPYSKLRTIAVSAKAECDQKDLRLIILDQFITEVSQISVILIRWS